MALSSWHYRRHNKHVIFIYKVGAMTPAFKFTSERGLWPFKGHGHTFLTKHEMLDYIERNGNFMMKKELELEANSN